jgi:hypothetical protein
MESALLYADEKGYEHILPIGEGKMLFDIFQDATKYDSTGHMVALIGKKK